MLLGITLYRSLWRSATLTSSLRDLDRMLLKDGIAGAVFLVGFMIFAYT